MCAHYKILQHFSLHFASTSVVLSNLVLVQEQMKLQQLAAERQELTFRPAVNRTGTARINLRNPETYLQTLKARNEARAQQAKDEVRRRLVRTFIVIAEDVIDDSMSLKCHASPCMLALMTVVSDAALAHAPFFNIACPFAVPHAKARVLVNQLWLLADLSAKPYWHHSGADGA